MKILKQAKRLICGALILLTATVVLFFSGVALATRYDIVNATYVDWGNIDTNYGNDTILKSGWSRAAFIELPENIGNVTIHLYVNDGSPASNIEFYSTSQFDENTLTANNVLDWGGGFGVYPVVGGQWNSYLFIDPPKYIILYPYDTLDINSDDNPINPPYITLPEPENPAISPAAINDLVAWPGTNPGEIVLNWTAVGDDGNNGDIVGGQYRIKYTTDPIYSFPPDDYDIQIGADTTPGERQSYQLNGLSAGTVYYIAIRTADEWRNWGEVSNIASSLAGNYPPEIPSNPYPADGTTGVGRCLDLSWECSDPEGDPLTFAVRFGTTNPPTNIGSSNEKKYTIDDCLEINTNYYWQIVATDSKGAVTAGPIWSFVTTIGFTDIDVGLTGVKADSLDWGDYDNDGDLDLALTGYDYNNGQYVSRIYENKGNGIFSDIEAGLTAVRQDGALSWGDYDHDGDLDLALSGYSTSNDEHEVSKIYRNDGGGIFTEINAGLTGVSYGSFDWGDYDNDGDLDLALAGSSSSGYVSKIYRNEGGGIFTEIDAGLTGVSSGSLDWGDYDQDGDLDLALAGSSSSGYVSKIYRNDGGGIFTDINAGLTGVYNGSIVWGDYDQDGDLDLALAGSSSSGYVSKIYRNDGGGIFTDINAGLTGVRNGSLSWGDYDNDRDLDLVLSGQTGYQKVRIRSLRHVWNQHQNYWTYYWNDRTVPAYTSKIYQNKGNGIFSDIEVGLTGVGNSSLSWGDYDSDGDLDLVLGGAVWYIYPVSEHGVNYDQIGYTGVTKIYRSEVYCKQGQNDGGGGGGGGGGDTTAPGTITDLAATLGTNSGEINLNWTAVGDDGYSGNITNGKYRIAYSSVSVSESVSNYNIELTTDTVVGQGQTYTITGLTVGTSYYFAIWTADEVPNWSDISNRATSWLQLQVPETDTIPPGAITDLAAAPGTNSGEINLNWTAVGDDGYSGDIVNGKYRIAYSSVSVSESVSNYNIELTTDTVVGQGQTYTISGLTTGTSYYFAIWTADEVPNWSPISNIANSLTENNLITTENHPPEIPNNPYPADAAINLGANISLSWECRDPDGDALIFDIYFGTNNLVSLLGKSSEKKYSLQSLDPATTYYWQIIATDSQGAVSRGPLWKFSTGVSTIVIPPDPPIIDDGGGDITIDLPDNYDLYLGTTNPPGYIGNPPYTITGLDPATTYYWQIVATDDQGFKIEGPIWSFITDNFSLYGDITGISDYDQLLLLLLPANWGEDPVNIIPQDVHRSEVNKQGRYSFTDLPPGEYAAYLVRKNNFKIIHHIPSLTIIANKASKLDITVHPLKELNTGTISGQINNRIGQSLESFVLLKDIKEQLLGIGVTDLGGNFRFAGLDNDRYEVFASADKYVVDKVTIAATENRAEQQEIKVVLYYPTIELNKNETVEGEDRVIRVEVPATTFTRRTGIIIKKRSSGQDIETANSKLNIRQDFWKDAIYEIRAVAAVYQENNNRMTNGKKAKISFQYFKSNASQLVAGKTQQPWIHRLGGDIWTKVAGPQEADSAQGKVSTWIEEFSIFRILALAEENLNKFAVYPNPFKPNSRPDHKWIVFSGLTSRVKIEIFTLSGIKVREINKDDNRGSYIWDAQNGEGKALASGIYIYLITNDNGEKRIGKLGIVK